MAKPIVVTLPFMLLLLDYWPLQRLSLTDLKTTTKQLGQLLKEKVPLFLITLLFSLIQMHLSKEMGCTRIDYPLKLRLSNALISYVAYLKMSFWPRNLAVFYPYQTTIPLTQVIVSILILLTITVITLVYLKKYPFLIVGWGWFLVTLLPNIGIIQMGEQARADRFTYVAHIGLMIMIVWLAAAITAKLVHRQALLTIISTSSIMVLTTLSWVQVGFWQNSRTLFEQTLAVTSNNTYIHSNFAVFLVLQHEMDEAEKHFRDALSIEPWNNVSRKNLAYVLDVKGLKAEAQRQLAIAQSIDEAPPKPKIDIDDFINIGASLYRHNFIEESQRYYQLASQADPQRPEPYLQLGNILRSQNRLPEAIETYHKALQLKVDYAEVYNNLGVALAQQQRYAEAQQQFSLALKYKPDYLGAQENLAKVVAILKDTK